MPDVPPTIVELVETFDRNIDAYKNQSYNEAQVRREFIDPFFEALGWDIANKQGLAPAYKDVIHEDAIKVGATNKKIGSLVYKLYNLTPKEIAIIEETRK
ncbi:MAG TPA: type I restriction endonuclease [Sedimentisphaerales bacterium]|nr:type I restriction endonuclease [Sedimentisphaerales bacterium]